jgi:hypothetical protein
MSKQVLNNFIFGETDKNILGRTDLKAYLNGASQIENFKLNPLGGLSKREGSVEILNLEKRTRVIEFIYSADLSFLLLFSEKELRVVDTLTEKQIGDVLETEYLEDELYDIQYAQNEESVFFVHINHPIKVFDYVGNTFSFSTFVGTYDDEHKGILSTENNYPSVVAYCSSRLYFASSRNQPYTIWISNSFEPTKFWTYTIGTSTVTEQCSYDEYSTYFNKWKNGEKECSKSYSTWYYNILVGSTWWSARLQYEPSAVADYNDLLQTDTQLFGEVMTVEDTETTKTYTDENAMILELASSRNDKICNINILHNIVVGTRSSEWILPYDLTPSNLKATKESSYGSSFKSAISLQNELLFLQSSGCLRSMKYDYTNYNYPCEDRTMFNKDILSSGVLETASQLTPYCRLFCVLKDGTLAVMTKNELDSVYGWTRYKSDYFTYESVAVAEVEGVQQVYVMVRLNSEQRHLLKFDETKVADGCVYDEETKEWSKGLGYIAKLTTNPIESSSLQTLDSLKYGWNISLKTRDTTNYKVGFDGCIMQSANGESDNNLTIQAPTSWTKELRVVIESDYYEKININALLINMGAV